MQGYMSNDLSMEVHVNCFFVQNDGEKMQVAAISAEELKLKESHMTMTTGNGGICHLCHDLSMNVRRMSFLSVGK